jgi:hypothetical protein
MRPGVTSIRRVLVAGALVLPCMGCRADASGARWRGTVHQHGLAVEVRSPAAPVFGEGAAAAELLWTTPEASGDAMVRDWSLPAQVALGAGEIYVLDPLAHRVHVVSGSGEMLRQVGRAGKGPGELQAPFGLAFLNGLLAVGNAGRIDLFSPAGEPAGSVALGTIAFSLDGLEPGHLLVKTFRGEQKLYPVRGNAPPVSLPGFPLMDDEAEFACSRVSGAGDHILRLDCAKPVFQVISRHGTLLRTVRIRRDPVPATRDELDRFRRSLASDAAKAGSTGGETRSLIDRLLEDATPKRVMRGIQYDTAAHLYAVWEQQPKEFGNGPAQLHLFGREGVFLVTIPFPEPWVDFAIDGLTVYALVEAPDIGVVRLSAYRLRLAPGVRAVADAPL